MSTVVSCTPIMVTDDRVSQVEMKMDDGSTVIHFLSIHDIVMNMLAHTEVAEIEALSKLEESDLIQFHHTVGREIRNEYNLWHEHCPLTKSNPIIVDGVDINPLHPDSVSQLIIVEMWKWAKLNVGETNGNDTTTSD